MGVTAAVEGHKAGRHRDRRAGRSDQGGSGSRRFAVAQASAKFDARPQLQGHVPGKADGGGIAAVRMAARPREFRAILCAKAMHGSPQLENPSGSQHVARDSGWVRK